VSYPEKHQVKATLHEIEGVDGKGSLISGEKGGQEDRVLSIRRGKKLSREAFGWSTRKPDGGAAGKKTNPKKKNRRE